MLNKPIAKQISYLANFLGMEREIQHVVVTLLLLYSLTVKISRA